MKDDLSWELVPIILGVVSLIYMYMQSLPAPYSSGFLHSSKTIQLKLHSLLEEI